MVQSREFFGKFLGPLLKTGLPLIKNAIKSLAKSVLNLLGLTAAASAADVAIHKKILGSGNTTLIMEDTIKKILLKSLEESGFILK